MSSSSPQEPLRLSADDLYSPRVDAFLDEQAMLNRALPESSQQPFIVRVLYSSYFYLSLASGLGAFVAWMIIEPFFDDRSTGPSRFRGLPSCCFPRSMGFVGMFLGAAEGIMCRNVQRAPICAAVGLGIGFAGGFVAWILAEIIYIIIGRRRGAIHEGSRERATADGPRPPDHHDGPGRGLGGGGDPRGHRPGDRVAREQGPR